MLQTTSRLATPIRAPRVLAETRRRALRMNPWIAWRPARPSEEPVLSVAELADCTCPDLCNRDHANE